MLEKEELHKLFRPVLDVILHSLGVNKNPPLVLVHGGSNVFGLVIDNFFHVQGVAQLQLLLGHLNKEDRTGKLIRIEKDNLELLIGLGKCPLLHPHTTQYKYVPNKWITYISLFLCKLNSKVEVRGNQVIKLQSKYEHHLMQISVIQQC